VAAAVLSTEPDALLQTLGNHAYENGSASEFANCYDPTYGVYKARTRPAMGNHDNYALPAGAGYRNYFSAQLAALGPTASDPTKLYYSYDLGAWHVVVLNDTCLVSGSGGTPGCDEAAQEQWLRNDLSTHPNDCVLGIVNRPRWSSDNNQGRTDHGIYWDIFYQYGVDLWLSGAAHHYERFAPMDPSGNLDLTYGIREIISGHGGYASNPIFSLMHNSEVYDDTSYGALKLTLHSGSYDWQFMPIADGVNPGGGSFTDSGSNNCHAAPPPSVLPYHEQVLAASPAAYWRLGETSGTSAADETGANPGTYNNVLLGEPSALSSDSNPSASFSGTQSYVRVPDSPSLDMTSAVTIELWAKRRTIGGYQVLVGKPGNGQSKFENYALWLVPSNRYTAYFGNGSTSVSVVTPAITDTNWHYVVATYNGSRARIYLDGVLKQDIASTLQLTPNTLPLNIGRANANNYFFNGWLDEVAVYPTALPAQTIVAHYNRATGSP
jgi:Concanavalin A-like lectin/glucanases superfamily